jgi:hypothetical protein
MSGMMIRDDLSVGRVLFCGPGEVIRELTSPTDYTRFSRREAHRLDLVDLVVVDLEDVRGSTLVCSVNFAFGDIGAFEASCATSAAR